ncbi:hypothetical protein [Streptomyces collinus]|uniref:hypothetical protein n=1 Tax=Streptomyces collinus TaxID=42684 RepID=UPI00380DFF6C
MVTGESPQRRKVLDLLRTAPGPLGVRGEDLPRSRGHLWYVALEFAKVLALVALGVGLVRL